MPGWAATTWFVDASVGTSGDGTTTPFKTITEAINNGSLAAGDTIQVAPGNYDTALGESFPLFLVDGVAIVGDPNDPNSTVISAPVDADDFYNNGSLGNTTRLAGFTLKHDDTTSKELVGMDFGDGVNQTPTIDHNVLIGVPAVSKFPGGIEFGDSDSGNGSFGATIENNRFESLWDGIWGGVYNGGIDSMTPIIRNNTFDGCNRSIYFTAMSMAGGTVAPQILDNSTTNTGGYDVDVMVTLFSSATNDLLVAPVITGNTFDGTGKAAVHMSLSGTQDTGATLTFNPTIKANKMTNLVGAGVKSVVDPPTPGSGPVVSNVTISGNRITGASGNTLSGIDVTLSSMGSAKSTDINYTIEGNTIGGFKNGIFVTMNQPLMAPGDSIDVTIRGNSISESTNGIWLTGYSFGNGSLTLLAEGNSVTGVDYEGLSFWLDSLSSLSTADIRVENNFLNGSGDDGFFYHGQIGTLTKKGVSARSVTENPTTVSCNTFSNNDIGAQINFKTSDATPPDFGGGNLSSFGHNVFTGNGTWALENLSTLDVTAQQNFWDAGNPDDVIYDHADNSSVGLVDFSNSLSSAADAAPNVTTAMQLDVINDVAPVGPSVGDTFRVTVTATQTGVCAGSAYSYSSPIPSNTTLVPGSLTATQGIPIEGDPVEVLGMYITPSQTATITYDLVATSGSSIDVNGNVDSAQQGTTANAQTPLAAPTIPTASEWGLIIMLMLLGTAGLWTMRRRRRIGTIVLILAVAGLPIVARAAQGRAPHATEHAGKIASTRVAAGEIQIRMADGTFIHAPSDAVRLRFDRERPAAARTAQKSMSRVDRKVARETARKQEATMLRELRAGTLDLSSRIAFIREIRGKDAKDRRVVITIFSSKGALDAWQARRDAARARREAKRAKS